MGLVLAGVIGFAIVSAVLKMQQNAGRGEEERRAVQRARRVGLAPIRGADGIPPEREED